MRPGLQPQQSAGLGRRDRVPLRSCPAHKHDAVVQRTGWVPSWQRQYVLDKRTPSKTDFAPSAVGYGMPVKSWSDSQNAEGPDLGWRRDMDDVVDAGRPLGAGSFGQVRQGLLKQCGNRVAIKSMSKVRGSLTKMETIDKIRNEVQMLALVQDCPAVIKLYHTFEDASSAYVVTELCQGGDLKKYVEERGPLDEKALQLVANEMLTFLKACHDKNVVYADVKPANFCLMDVNPFQRNSHHSSSLPPNFLKAIDMGSSKIASGRGARLHKRMGTLLYMSPEVFGSDFSFKADMWSLGVTLYWLFCHRSPYWPTGPEPPLIRLDTMEDLAWDLKEEDILPALSQMSPEGRDFIVRCLNVVESQRLSVKEALKHPWISALRASREKMVEKRPVAKGLSLASRGARLRRPI